MSWATTWAALIPEEKPFYNSKHSDFNPILHTWFRDSCFTCDGSSTIKVSHLFFNIGMVH
jgi:hypothetical protein